MQFFPTLRFGVLIAAACLCLQGQNPPAKEAPPELKGMPPRSTPSDYQVHEQAGAVTIAAEFRGHSVPSPQGTLTTEDYVAVELGFFGADGARLKLSSEDFTLRVNRKKTYPTRPFGLVISTVKDPEYEPPEPPAKKEKTSLNTGGGGGGDGRQPGDPPPAPPPIPIGVQRAMAQRVQKAALPEGDRALPTAGLIFFQYRGKVQSIRSLELIYNGPAGKAILPLQ
jgi:hypothetical protein